MKKTILLLAALLLPATALPQASVQLRVDLPVVLPQLVVVSPGVQVVPDVDEEVFFVDGFYWVRHDQGWYRSRSHRRGWVLVPQRVVPVRLVEVPRGKYRRWHPVREERRDDRHDHDRHDRHDHDRGHDRHDDHGRGHDHHDGDHGRDRGHDRGHGKGHGKHRD